MSTDRLEALKSMLQQDPKNSFVRYGLAQTLANMGRLEEAAQNYRELMEANPDYVAAYFHCGQTLEKMGRIDDARTIYEEGMSACTRTGDMHTRSEIQAALDILG
jgi:tetratricopeptide (TPR) repeat protein